MSLSAATIAAPPDVARLPRAPPLPNRQNGFSRLHEFFRARFEPQGPRGSHRCRLAHSERGRLLLTGSDMLVIDEDDRMLDMGFIPDIERICKLLPFTRQTLFFSATMPAEIQRLTSQFLHNPERIEASRTSST